MVNAVSKGRRTELKGVRFLEEDGWRITRAHRSAFNQVDLFGLFDAIAKKKNINRYIQFKTNTIAKQTKVDIEQFKIDFGCEHETFEIWCWLDKKGFQKIYWSDMTLEQARTLVPDIFDRTNILTGRG